MSRFVLSLLISLLSLAALADDDPFAKALARHREQKTFCFDGSGQFHDPMIDICAALGLNASADVTARAIAKNLGVSNESARDLGIAALAAMEADDNDTPADGIEASLRAAEERLVALLAREPNRAPVFHVIAEVAAKRKAPREAFEKLRELLRRESDPSAAIVMAKAVMPLPAATDILLGDALARWPDDAELIDAIGESTYDTLPHAAFGPISITARGAELRKRAQPLDTATLTDRSAAQLRAIASLGLPQTLIAAFETLPKEVQTKLRAQTNDSADVGVALAAAEELVGRRVESRAHAMALKSSQQYSESGVSATKRVILAATVDDGTDAFDLAIDVFAAGHEGPTGGVTGRVFAALLEKRGYAQLAAQILDDSGPKWALSRAENVSPAFDAILQPLRMLAEETIAADRARIKLLTPPTAQSHSLTALIEAKRIVPFTERPLPAAVTDKSLTVIDCSDAAAVAATTHLPPFVSPIRIERRGEEVVAIGISSAVDPVGEVGLGGYWVLRSQDGGNSWNEYYTGLRENMPYVVVPSSHLPLLAGDRMQIEVDVKELDTSSITFPPIALRLSREQHGLYLDFPLAELMRDSDGDGVTDLLEEHLVMDPNRADSDGDGAGDNRDPLPQVAFDGTPSVETAVVLAAVLEPFHLGGRRIVTGIAEATPVAESACDIRTSLIGAPVLFVVGDRTNFAPMSIDRRVVVLTDDELAAYSKKFGPTYGARIQHFVIDHSGTRAIIELNQSWAGSTLLLKKTKDGWTIERQLTSWIT
ncbi:MAG: hypothetical protein QOI24_3164 [Acidobacteriota bacterium]|jgi:hypothetical protein|nr:hypothetical protein [Acidobacteriota bacterium]